MTARAPAKEITVPVSVDDLLEKELGWRGFGPAQILALLIGGLAYTTMALIMFQMTFTYTDPLTEGGPPSWRFVEGANQPCLTGQLAQRQIQHAPVSDNATTTLQCEVPSFCDLRPSQYVWLHPETSLSAEYNLVCGQKWKASLLDTLFFAGFMTGNGIFGTVSDRHGRRATLAGCAGATAVLTALSASPLVPLGPGARAAQVAAAAGPVSEDSAEGEGSGSTGAEGGGGYGFWIHLVLRCLAGVACAGQALGAYVLATEMVGPVWRGAAGILIQMFYILGEFLLVSLSLAFPGWRALTLALAVACAVVMLGLPLVPESPRWLLLHGKPEKARDALIWVARLNFCRPVPTILCTAAGEVLLLPRDQPPTGTTVTNSNGDSTDEEDAALLGPFSSPEAQATFAAVAHPEDEEDDSGESRLEQNQSISFIRVLSSRSSAAIAGRAHLHSLFLPSTPSGPLWPVVSRTPSINRSGSLKWSPLRDKTGSFTKAALPYQRSLSLHWYGTGLNGGASPRICATSSGPDAVTIAITGNGGGPDRPGSCRSADPAQAGRAGGLLSRAGSHLGRADPVASPHTNASGFGTPDGASGAGDVDVAAACNTDDNDGDAASAGAAAAPSSVGLLTALAHPATRGLLLSTSLTLFALSMSYFGVTLALGSLVAGSLHLNFALTAAAELPGYLFIAATTDRLGRKLLMGSGTALAGAACLACAFTTAGPLQVALAMIGKLGCSGAWAMGLTFSAELFPTCLRSAALSLAGQSGDVGGLVTPALLLLSPPGKWERLPFGVMGLMSLAAVAAIVRLPETRGMPQLDTFEELLDWLRSRTASGGGRDSDSGDIDATTSASDQPEKPQHRDLVPDTDPGSNISSPRLIRSARGGNRIFGSECSGWAGGSSEGGGSVAGVFSDSPDWRPAGERSSLEMQPVGDKGVPRGPLGGGSGRRQAHILDMPPLAEEEESGKGSGVWRWKAASPGGDGGGDADRQPLLRALRLSSTTFGSSVGRED